MIRAFTPEFEYFVAGLAAIIALVTYVSVKHWNRFHKHASQPQWIILYVCSLHSIWGFSLIFLGKSDIAAWAGFALLPTWGMIILMLGSSSMSYYALIKDKSIVWMLPQQALAMIAAIGCITMVILGHYADGDPHPRIFILRDQLPEILTAIWHTCAIFHRERQRLFRVYDARLQCRTS